MKLRRKRASWRARAVAALASRRVSLMAPTSKQRALRQPMLSSFFAQSTPKPTARKRRDTGDEGPIIDLTEESDGENSSPAKHAAKKQKTAHVNDHLFLPRTPSPQPSGKSTLEPGPSRVLRTPPTHPNSPSQSPAARRWRYEPTQTSPFARTESQEAEVRKKRERLVRALVADNSSFHRSSTAYVRDRSTSAVPGTNGNRNEEGDARSGASGDESDSQFKELQDMFALSSGKDKGKGRAKSGRVQPEKGGKKAEIGPSGQTYTPLEQQVSGGLIRCLITLMRPWKIRRLIAKHPDVLLMVEVGYKYKFFGEDAKVHQIFRMIYTGHCNRSNMLV